MIRLVSILFVFLSFTSFACSDDSSGNDDGNNYFDSDLNSDTDTDTDSDSDTDADTDTDTDSDTDTDTDSDSDGDCTPNEFGVCSDGRCVGEFCLSFLEEHNKVRQAVNDGTYLSQPQAVPPMDMMRWDPLIALKAQEYADSMDNWSDGHSSSDFRTYASTWYDGYHGENMAIGSKNGYKAVREAWCDSEATGCTLSSCGGHYTQVVWRDSVAVGCGWKKDVPFSGYSGLLTVCEYGPGGNMGGMDPY